MNSKNVKRKMENIQNNMKFGDKITVKLHKTAAKLAAIYIGKGEPANGRATVLAITKGAVRPVQFPFVSKA